MKIIALCCTLAYLLLPGFCIGQDAVFSQFYNSTLYLNPALAGIEDDFLFSANHRTQWGVLQFPYVTDQISFIVPYHQSKHAKPFGHVGGMGLSVYNDVAGEYNSFKTTGVNGNFAYNLPFDKDHLNVITFGLQVGAIQKRIDTSELQWGSQYDPFNGFNSQVSTTEAYQFQNRAFIDIGSGIFWFYNTLPEKNAVVVSMNSGLSVSHMNNPNESLLDYSKNRLPLLYKYHGGIVFRVSRQVTFSTNTLVAYQNEIFQENIGTYFSYRFFPGGESVLAESIFRIGAWYRVNDSVIALTEFETTKFKLGFSYDWNTSSLRYQSRGFGTYEIHMQMKFTQNAPPKIRY